MVAKIVFWLPLTLQRWFISLMVSARYSYKPSSEPERERSEYMRNKIRLADYYIKRSGVKKEDGN